MNYSFSELEPVYCEGMQVVVEIPDEFVSALAPHGEDLPRQLLEDRVAQLYRDGSLTTAEVRRVLGFSSRWEVEPFLAKYGIVDYTIDEFREDMKTLQRLRQRA
jgi:hypothetical protein